MGTIERAKKGQICRNCFYYEMLMADPRPPVSVGLCQAVFIPNIRLKGSSVRNSYDPCQAIGRDGEVLFRRE